MNDIRHKPERTPWERDTDIRIASLHTTLLKMSVDAANDSGRLLNIALKLQKMEQEQRQISDRARMLLGLVYAGVGAMLLGYLWRFLSP